MTSEAVLAGLRLSGLESSQGAGDAKGRESRGTPPLDAIQKDLGADAAIWNRIKAVGVSESAAVESKAASEQQSSVPSAAPVSDNRGFVALPVPSLRRAIGRPGHAAVFSSQTRVPQEVRSADGSALNHSGSRRPW